ncbi:MAG: hypothetical protein GY754_29925 [bacterium]|nr:hypothetical protein [bacterium]
MRKRTLLMILMLISLSIVFIDKAFAAPFNKRNYLSGGRAAMLGGAYTALSEDISGALYNPAGIVFLDNSSLSIQGTIYSYVKSDETTTYKIKDSGGNIVSELTQDMNIGDFVIVPTTLGYSISFPPYIGLSFSVFQLDSTDFNSYNPFELTINSVDIKGYKKLKMVTKDYLLGPTIAFSPGAKIPWSIGVSAFVYYFDGDYEFRYFSQVPATSEAEANIIDATASSFGFIPVVGIKGYITDELQAGVSFMFETVHLSGTGQWTYEKNLGNGSTPVITSGSDEPDYRLPHKLAVGLAYESPGFFTVAVDCSYYFKLDYISNGELLTIGTGINRHKEKGHFDISVGGELYVAPGYALRLGFFTNTSGADMDGYENLKVNQVGFATGLGIVSSNGLSTNLGVIVMTGGSDYSIEDSSKITETSLETLSIQFIYSATVNFLKDENECDKESL